MKVHPPMRVIQQNSNEFRLHIAKGYLGTLSVNLKINPEDRRNIPDMIARHYNLQKDLPLRWPKVFRVCRKLVRGSLASARHKAKIAPKGVFPGSDKPEFYLSSVVKELAFLLGMKIDE